MRRALACALMAGLLASGSVIGMGTAPQKGVTTTTVGMASVMLRDDDLRVAPDANAAVLARLARGSAVRVLAGEGGWTQVSADGRVGWVRILSVRDGGSAASARDVGALAGRREPGEIVAVAGVRGLDEVALSRAEYDAEELLRLDTYAVGRDEAEQYARAADLRARTMQYLAAPSAAAARPTPGWSWIDH